jgi:hypothetical protein
VVLEDDEQAKTARDEGSVDDERVPASGSGLDVPTEEAMHAESIDELDEGTVHCCPAVRADFLIRQSAGAGGRAARRRRARGGRGNDRRIGF